MYKNEAGQKLYLYAWDAVANIPKTGDAANISVEISKDGAAQASLDDSSATEIGDGVYVFDLLQAETNADAIAFTGSSTTAGVMVDPVIVYTHDRLAVLADGVTHGGSTAKLELETIDVTNSSGDAVTITSGSNDTGLVIQGGQKGAEIKSGSSGTGLSIRGGIVGGNGIYVVAPAGNGLDINAPAGFGMSINAPEGISAVETDAILADTSELQTDWANGGRLDLLLDAVSTHAAADVWAVAMENSKSYAEVMRVIAAVLTGKTSIASDEITFTGIDGTTERLKVAVSNGARTSVDTWDGSP